VGKSFRQHSSSAGTWTDLGLLVIGISLRPKYVTVRGVHVICRNQPLKTLKRAIMCIKTISNQLHTSDCISIKLKNIPLFLTKICRVIVFGSKKK